MKKKLKTKLALDRETVTVLQSDSLDAAVGGCANCTPTNMTKLLGCGGGQTQFFCQQTGGLR